MSLLFMFISGVLLFFTIGMMAQMLIEMRRAQRNCENATKICEEAVKSLKDGGV